MFAATTCALPGFTTNVPAQKSSKTYKNTTKIVDFTVASPAPARPRGQDKDVVQDQNLVQDLVQVQDLDQDQVAVRVQAMVQDHPRS